MNIQNVNPTMVLVTEANSFLGMHLIAALVKSGYAVRATLPPLCFKRDVISCLSTLGISCASGIDFIKADSTGQYNWDRAISGCRYIMYNSTSSFTGKSKNKFRINAPSAEGIGEVMKNIKGHQVERVILSAYPASELDLQPALSEVVRSGRRAMNQTEIAARQAIEDGGLDVALTVIHSGGIFGPKISRCCSDWIDLIKKIISGGVKKCPDCAFGVVDVRDLAELHVLAMSHPEALNECFAACSDGQYTVYEIVQLITSHRPHFSASISALLPNPSYRNWEESNQKAKAVLGWRPKSKEEAILASVDSIFN